jgi:DNA-binding response OmpR family regulator
LIVNVDDHDSTRFLRTRVLTQEGYRVVEPATAAGAREHGAAGETELTLLDINLPDGSGFNVCRTLKEDRPAIHCITFAGRSPSRGAGGDLRARPPSATNHSRSSSR